MEREFTGAETPFEKWHSLISCLNQLTDIPEQMRQQLLTQVFDSAEIDSFTTEQRSLFALSLKRYRDLKNSLDTAREEGRKAGLEMARQEIALAALQAGTATGLMAAPE